jgi:hypothetical protein
VLCGENQLTLRSEQLTASEFSAEAQAMQVTSRRDSNSPYQLHAGISLHIASLSSRRLTSNGLLGVISKMVELLAVTNCCP